MTLTAPARRTFITWPDLVALGYSEFLGGPRMKWRARNRLTVTAPIGFVDVHKMVDELPRRAPHVQVAGAVPHH